MLLDESGMQCAVIAISPTAEPVPEATDAEDFFCKAPEVVVLVAGNEGKPLDGDRVNASPSACSFLHRRWY